MENLVKVINNNVIITDEARSKLQQLKDVKTQPQNYKKEFEKQLKKAMEENNLKLIKNDVFTARYIKGGTRKIFDIDEAMSTLEDYGFCAEDFKKEIKVKSSLQIKYK